MRQQLRTSTQFSRLGLVLLLGCLLMLGLARPVHAADFRGGTTATVGENEVIDDDLFISGDIVTVNGTVKGNLFATGNTVTVNGHVEGSLFLAGRTLAQNGVVDGSTYVGGYAFTLGKDAAVGYNLNFGGYSLTADAGSTVGRSLYGAGYQLLLHGQVERDVYVNAAALEVTGVVGGDLQGNVGSSTESAPSFMMPQFEGAVPPVLPGLRISPEAHIGGVLAVKTPATVAERTAPPPFFSLQNSQLRWAVGEFLALLLVGLLLLYVRPVLLHRAGTAIQERWLPSLGIGMLTLVIAVIAVPVFAGIVILLAVLGGWVTLGHLVGAILGLGATSLGFAIALFLFVALMITKIVVAYTGGTWLMRKLAATTEPSVGMEMIGLALGILIYVALRMIPFSIGGIVAFLVTLLGLGAIYFALRGRQQPLAGRAPAPVGPMTEAHI